MRAIIRISGTESFVAVVDIGIVGVRGFLEPRRKHLILEIAVVDDGSCHLNVDCDSSFIRYGSVIVLHSVLHLRGTEIQKTRSESDGVSTTVHHAIPIRRRGY